MKKYIFKAYSIIFPELFQKERDRIASNVNIRSIIEHIGSTAVPGLGGKGIIDIGIAIDKQDMELASKKLQAIGYEFRPNFSSEDRFYFIAYLPDLEEGTRKYHIHLTYPGNPEWKEFLGFRDYLRSHPKALQKYAELKQQAVSEARDEGERYRKIKEPMFKEISAKISTINEPINILVRQAKLEDACAIVEAERAIAEEPGFFCSQPSELDEKAVKQTIQSPQSIYLVAEYEGQIVGHAFLEPYTLQSLRHVADLNIAVTFRMQKKGIGTKLLESTIEWAKNSGVIEKIQLNVRASNTTAIPLYKKMGFEEEGRLKNRVKIKDRYIDDIIMGLDLVHGRNNPKLERQDITIRVMQAEDINTLIKIFCFPWNSVEATRDKWVQYYKEHQEQIRTVYLLEKHGHILGYASLLRQSHYPDFKDNGIPEINDVWISAEYRGNGLGKSLVRHLEKMAHQENHRQIGIGVGLYKDYGRAQKLYIHLGYVPDGRGVTYKSQPVVPGDSYPVDDDLLIWLKKDLS